MESKISDWNTRLRHKTCPECGTKLTHKQKQRQITPGIGSRQRLSGASWGYTESEYIMKKVRERLRAVYDRDRRFREVKEKLMNHLNSGDVNGALEYLQYLKARFRKRYRKKQLAVLAAYIERNRHGIWYSIHRSWLGRQSW